MKNRRVKIMLCIFIIAAFAAYLFIFAFHHKNFSGKTTISDNNQSAIDSSAENSLLYDTSPVSWAYFNNDTSKLDDFQLEIYNRAVTAINETIKPDMTDYEKELAVHDYIALHTQYDDGALSALGKYSENAENPYGVLVNGKSICSGYTTTFQLFMDMLKIPCKSVFAADHTGSEHAWNMVELDNEWYYVDVTWDDATPDYSNRPVRHKYFNVTEEYMKLKHVWDSSQLPQAISEDNSYISHNLNKLTDIEQALPIMENELNNMNDCAYFDVDKSFNADISKADGIDTYYDFKENFPQLENVFEEFVKNHKEFSISCQRVKYKDTYVLAVYMIKNKEA